MARCSARHSARVSSQATRPRGLASEREELRVLAFGEPQDAVACRRGARDPLGGGGLSEELELPRDLLLGEAV